MTNGASDNDRRHVEPNDPDMFADTYNIQPSYPREHEPLGHQLLDDGGAIVTEYPAGSPPDGWRFPPRMRLAA